MYESDQTTVTDALRSSNPTVFSDQTIRDILALTTQTNGNVPLNPVTPDSNGNVTVPVGNHDVVLVSSPDTFQTVVKPPANAPVVIFQGRGGVVATINDPSATVPSGDQTHVDRVVVGSAGNDRIIVQDARNTKVILGTGDSSVTTGHGVDTVEAGLGNSTIVGGGGDYAVVKLAGSASNYQVTVNNGHAVVTDNTSHKTTDISKIQYVQLDQGKALVFASNSVEAEVATLYHTAFGRDADAGGLNYFFDLAKSGASLTQIAKVFTNTAEFKSQASLSDTAFIQSLYQNTFGRAGEDAGVAYWTDALAHGSTRADLILQFAQIGVHNIDGTPHTEAQVIGNVTIVSNII